MFFKKKCGICRAKNPKDAITCASCSALLASGQVMVLDSGYLSSDFVTNRGRMEAVLEKPWVLITDKKITTEDDLFPALKKILPMSDNLLIVADGVEGEALDALVVNKLRGILRIVAVEPPGTGDSRKAVLQDIATLTNGRVISGRKLDSITLEDLGRVHRVTTDKDKTTFLIEGRLQVVLVSGVREDVVQKRALVTAK